MCSQKSFLSKRIQGRFGPELNSMLASLYVVERRPSKRSHRRPTYRGIGRIFLPLALMRPIKSPALVVDEVMVIHKNRAICAQSGFGVDEPRPVEDGNVGLLDSRDFSVRSAHTLILPSRGITTRARRKQEASISENLSDLLTKRKTSATSGASCIAQAIVSSPRFN